MKVMPRARLGTKNRNPVTVSLLPVPVFAFPEWNRRVRDWMQS